MDSPYRFWPWFLINWSRPTLVIAAILLALIPFLHNGISFIALLVFLQSPIYMIHQYEEHAQGAFKAFVNREIGQGREVLSDIGIVVINIGGVWALNLVVLYLAVYVRPALGLIAIYLSVVNGLSHMAASLLTRAYNPGLWTSIGLFLPIGITSIVLFGTHLPLTWVDQAIGIGAAILVHLIIIGAVLYNRAHLAAPASA